MVAVGGENNDLMVYNLAAQDVSTPVFKARNVQDHVLDVPYPVYIVGTCVINPFVFGTTTAYHQVRFYDSRASERPVQEFEISREIERRPTCMLQWNSNKFLIGEASGDVHLYDTRRGFTSRAKLRGGVGSVKSMCKHPAGHQLLSVTGLDRKVRLYHVPTGKLLQTFLRSNESTAFCWTRACRYKTMFHHSAGSRTQNNLKSPPLWVTNSGKNMDPIVDTLDDAFVETVEPAKKRRKLDK
ncbi:ribosome biogenesis protein NSA1 [Angomonas deanei]|nr:ribosome biogenesis protein NSA1 [Angomonas deanei]|eukprot:EPY26041.1 ribosome biogenesis protein NSA1 [Angomonas deanei]